MLDEKPDAEELSKRLFESLDEPPVRELWKQYFKTEVDQTYLRRQIQRLQRGKHFNHIVVALEEALRSGQSEPWMYEVLAISMEIEGYPKDDVERVLISMTDFNALDIPNLLGSAAYLVRLGAEKQALRIYRQVSDLQPTRPEPYLLGMRLADQLNDVDGILWSTTGILTYFWFESYETQHEKAIKLLEDWRLKLEQQGRTEEANQLAAGLKRALVRDLELKLTWSGDADLDLIVKEPLGTKCSYSEPHTVSGGALVHEGAGPTIEECFEHYICAFAAPGKYEVTIQHASGRITANRAKLEVIRYAGTEEVQRDVVPVQFDRATKIFRISLHEGRRTEKSPVFKPVLESKMHQRREKVSLHNMRMEMRSQGRIHAQLQNPVQGVGYAPQVGIVNTGTQLSANAVVSPDRRYVRIGVNTSVSEISDVFTFTFAGGR